MNKSLATNLVALAVTLIGISFSPNLEILTTVGFFALSGSVTNWIAIHMLFEKVPGLYGSGIIPNKFEEFKIGIRNLMMEQFFTKENIERFFADPGSESNLDLRELSSDIPYDKLFLKLKQGVIASPLGPMLQMFGGEQALDQLEEPVTAKMREAITEILQDEQLLARIKGKIREALPLDLLLSKVEGIVEARLAELTPELVKMIIQQMIREHLGWLVVWGGLFGGIMGMIAYIFQH